MGKPNLIETGRSDGRVKYRKYLIPPLQTGLPSPEKGLNLTAEDQKIKEIMKSRDPDIYGTAAGSQYTEGLEVFDKRITDEYLLTPDEAKQGFVGDYDYLYEKAAQDQGMFTRTMYAIPRTVAGVISKVGQNLSYAGGALLDAGTYFYSGGNVDLGFRYNQKVADWIGGLEKWVDEGLPIYQRQSYKDADTLLGKVFHQEFLYTDFLDGVEFLTAAYIGAKGLGGAMSKGGITNQYAHLGAGATLSSGGESGFEAAEMYASLKKELVGKVNPSTGKEFTKEEIETKARSAASTVFNYNAAFLLGTQAYQLKPFIINKSMNKSKNILDEVIKNNLKPEDVGRLWTTLKNVGLHVGSEKMEESLQNAIQNIEKDWARGFSDGGMDDILQKAFIDNTISFGKGVIGKELSHDEMEAATAMTIGGLLGAFSGFKDASSEVKAKKEERADAWNSWNTFKQEQRVTNNLFLDNVKSILQTSKDAKGNDVLTKDASGNVQINQEAFQKLFYQTLMNKNLADSQFAAVLNGDKTHMMFNQEIAASRAAFELQSRIAEKGLKDSDNKDRLIQEIFADYEKDETLDNFDKAELAQLKTTIRSYMDMWEKTATENESDFLRGVTKSKQAANDLTKVIYYNQVKLQALEKMRTEAANENKDALVSDIDKYIEDTKNYLNDIKNNKKEVYKRYEDETMSLAKHQLSILAIDTALENKDLPEEKRVELEDKKLQLQYEKEEMESIHGSGSDATKTYNSTEFDILIDESKRKSNVLGEKHKYFLRQGHKALAERVVEGELNEIKQLQEKLKTAQSEAEKTDLSKQINDKYYNLTEAMRTNADILTPDKFKQIGDQLRVTKAELTNESAISERTQEDLQKRIDILEEQIQTMRQQKYGEAWDMLDKLDAVAQPGILFSRIKQFLTDWSEGNKSREELLKEAKSLVGISNEDYFDEFSNLDPDEQKSLSNVVVGEGVTVGKGVVVGGNIANTTKQLLDSIYQKISNENPQEKQLADNKVIEEEKLTKEEERYKGLQENLRGVTKSLDSFDRFDEANKEIDSNKSRLQKAMDKADNKSIDRYFKRLFANRPIKNAKYLKEQADLNPESFNNERGVQNIIQQLQERKKVFKSENRKEDLSSSPFHGFLEELDETIKMMKDVLALAKANRAKRSAKQTEIAEGKAKQSLKALGLVQAQDGGLISYNSEIFDIIATVVPEADAILREAGKDLTSLGISADIIIDLFNKRAETSQVNSLISELEQINKDNLGSLNVTNKNDYSKSPAGNVMSILLRQYKNASETLHKDAQDETNDPFYIYEQDKDIDGFVARVKDSTRFTEEQKKEIISLVQFHLDYLANYDLVRTLESAYSLTSEFRKESELLAKIAESTTDDSQKQVPTYQQLFAIRQLIKFMKSPNGGSNTDLSLDRFMAYLKGVPGTGKTKIVIKWVMDILGIDPKKVYSFSHSELSSKGIAESTGTKQGSLEEFKKLDLATVDTIIIDEAGFFGSVTMDEIVKRIRTENKARLAAKKSPIRVMFLGDPSQITVADISVLEKATRFPYLVSIDPLTVSYRSDVQAIQDVFNTFDRISKPVKNITVKASTEIGKVYDPNNPTLGVHASDRGNLMRSLMANRNSGRSKVIIVNTDADKARYNNADVQSTGALVLTYYEAQGQTFSEVYIDLDRAGNNMLGDPFISDVAFNKAMFTAISRAQHYVYITDTSFKNMVDQDMQQDLETTKQDTADNYKRLKSYFDTSNKLMSKYTGETFKEVKDVKGVTENGTPVTEDNQTPTVEEEIKEELVVEPEVKEELVPEESDVTEVEDDVVDDDIIDEAVDTVDSDTANKDKDDSNDIDNLDNGGVSGDFDSGPINDNDDTLEMTNPQSTSFTKETVNGKTVFKQEINAGAPVVFARVNVRGDKAQTVALVQVFDKSTNKFLPEFRIIGVLSDEDRKTPFYNQHLSKEEGNGKISPYPSVDIANKAINSEAVFDNNGKLVRFKSSTPQLLKIASVKAAQALSFKYSEEPQPKGFIRRILDKFKANIIKSIGGIKKVQVKIYSEKSLKRELSDGYLRGKNTSVIKPGVPYLIVHSRNGQVFHIRLTPRKVNKTDMNEGGFLEPLKKVLDLITAYDNKVQQVGQNKSITLGNKTFGNIVDRFRHNFTMNTEGKPEWTQDIYTFDMFTKDLEDSKKQEDFPEGSQVNKEQFELIKEFAKEFIPLHYKFGWKRMEQSDSDWAAHIKDKEGIDVPVGEDGMIKDLDKYHLIRLENGKLVKALSAEEFKKAQSKAMKATYVGERTLQKGKGPAQVAINQLAKAHTHKDVFRFAILKQKGKNNEIQFRAGKALLADNEFGMLAKQLGAYAREMLLNKMNPLMTSITESQIKKASLRDLHSIILQLHKDYYGDTPQVEKDTKDLLLELEIMYRAEAITREGLEQILGNEAWDDKGDSKVGDGYLALPLSIGSVVNKRTGQVHVNGVSTLGENIISIDENGNETVDNEAIDTLEQMLDSKFEDVQPTRVQISIDTPQMPEFLLPIEIEEYANQMNNGEVTETMLRNRGINSNEIERIKTRSFELKKEKLANLRQQAEDLQEEQQGLIPTQTVEEPVTKWELPEELQGLPMVQETSQESKTKDSKGQIVTQKTFAIEKTDTEGYTTIKFKGTRSDKPGKVVGQSGVVITPKQFIENVNPEDYRIEDGFPAESEISQVRVLEIRVSPNGNVAATIKVTDKDGNVLDFEVLLKVNPLILINRPSTQAVEQQPQVPTEVLQQAQELNQQQNKVESEIENITSGYEVVETFKTEYAGEVTEYRKVRRDGNEFTVKMVTDTFIDETTVEEFEGWDTFDTEKLLKNKEDEKNKLFTEDTDKGKEITIERAYKIAQQFLPGIKRMSFRDFLSKITFGLIKPQSKEDVVVKFVTKEALTALNGGKPVAGLYRGSIVYVMKEYDAANKRWVVRENVVKHEVFHKIYNEYLSPNDRLLLRQSVLNNIKNDKEKARVSSLSPIAFEEYLAEQFQVYNTEAGTFKGRLKSFFDNIRSWFTYVKDNRTQLESFFDLIHTGYFKSGAAIYSHPFTARTLSNIKELFGDVNMLKEMIKEVQSLYGALLNDPKSTVSLDDMFVAITRSVKAEYFNSDKKILDLDTRIKKYKDIILDPSTKSDQIDFLYEQIEKLKVLREAEVSNRSGRATMMDKLYKNNYAALKEIIQWMFPAWDIESKTNTVLLGEVGYDNYGDIDQAAIDFMTHVNMREQIESAEMVNRERNMSTNVKMFLGIIPYEKTLVGADGKEYKEKRYINARASFVKVAEVLEGISFDKVGEVGFIQRLQEAMANAIGKTSFNPNTEEWKNSIYRPIYEKLLSLHKEATRNENGNIYKLVFDKNEIPTESEVTDERVRFISDKAAYVYNPVPGITPTMSLLQFKNATISELREAVERGEVAAISKREFEDKNYQLTSEYNKQNPAKPRLIEYYSTRTWLKDMSATFKIAEDDLVALWRNQEAKNTLAEIGAHFASLKQKNFRTVELVNEKGHRVIRYVGNISLDTYDALRSQLEINLATSIDDKIRKLLSSGYTVADVNEKTGRITKSPDKKAYESLVSEEAFKQILENLKSRSIAQSKLGIRQFLEFIGMNRLAAEKLPDASAGAIATDLYKFLSKHLSHVGDVQYRVKLKEGAKLKKTDKQAAKDLSKTELIEKVYQDNIDELEMAEEPVIVTAADIITEEGSVFSRLAEYLMINNEFVKSASIRNSEGNSIYPRNLSTEMENIMDIFIKGSPSIISGARGTRTNMKIPEFLKTKFFSNNIFLNGISFIKGVVDHDGTKNKMTDRTIPYGNETVTDWMSRNINAAFLDGIKTSKSGDLSYYQSLYALAHRKQMRLANVKLLSQSDIFNSLVSYLDQVSNRPYQLIEKLKGYKGNTHHNFDIIETAARNIGLFDKIHDVSYLRGLSTSSDKKALAEEMMKVLEKGAVDFANYLVQNTIPITANVDKILKKIWSDQFTQTLEEGDSIESTEQVAGKSYFKESYSINGKTKKVESFQDIALGEDNNNYVDSFVKLDNNGNRQYALTAEQLLPLVDLMYKNMYINGFYLNQLIAGDPNMFKNSLDQVKRMAGPSAPGIKGIVNDEFGMPKKFRAAIMSDVSEDRNYLENFLTRILSKGEFNTLDELRKESEVVDADTGKRTAEAMRLSELMEEIKEFSKEYGHSFDYGDGQGFITPERTQQFVRGFGRSYGVGNVFKGVHYEQVTIGTGDEAVTHPVFLKYSTVVLSDDLVKRYPNTLGVLRDKMENHPDGPVHELLFQSGVKVGAPKNPIDGYKAIGDKKEIFDSTSIYDLSNESYRLQLNPSKAVEYDEYKGVANPTQLSYFLNALQNVVDDTPTASEVVYQAMADLITDGANKFFNRFEPKGLFSMTRFRNFLSKIVKGVGNERVQESLEGGINYNAPHIANKVFSQLAAQLTDETVAIRFPGDKLVLQSAYGIELNQGVGEPGRDNRVVPQDKRYELSYYVGKNGVLNVEVIVPHGLFPKEMEERIKNGDEIFLTADAMGFRIPATELHSAVALKIVDFYDSKGTNIIIAPKELVPIHGSDFDVDSIFAIVRTLHKESDILNKLNGVIALLTNEGKLSGMDMISPNSPVGYRTEKDIDTGKDVYIFDRNFGDDLIELQRLLNEGSDNIIFTKQKKLNKKIHRELHSLIARIKRDYLKNTILETYLETITSSDLSKRMIKPINKEVFFGKDEDGNYYDDSMFGIIQRLNTDRAILMENEGLIDADTSSKMKKPQRDLDLSKPQDNYEAYRSNMEGLSLVGVFANAMKSIAYMLRSGKSPVQRQIDSIKTTLNNIKTLNSNIEYYSERETDDTLTEAQRRAAKAQVTKNKSKLNNAFKALRGLVGNKITLPKTVKELDITDVEKQVSEKIKVERIFPTPRLRVDSTGRQLGVQFNGKSFNELVEYLFDEQGGVSKKSLWETLDSLVNASIDNVKDQILPVINANGFTANALIAALTLGVPLKTAVLLIKQHSISSIQATGRKDTLISGQLVKLAKVYAYLKDGNSEAYQVHLNNIRSYPIEKALTDSELEIAYTQGFNTNLLNENDIENSIKNVYQNTLIKSKEALLGMLETQVQALQQFRELTAIGEDIANLSSALNIIRFAPAFKNDYDDIVDKWSKVFKKNPKTGQLEFNKEFSFTVPNFFDANPHIKAAYDNIIVRFGGTLSRAFYKYRKHFQDTLYKVYDNMKLGLDNVDSKGKTKFVDEFVRMLYTSIPLMKREEIMKSVKTYVTYFGQDGEKRGAEAWSQNFIDNVQTLQNSNIPELKNNRFLQSILIRQNPYSKMKYISFTSGSNLEYQDILEMQEHFKQLVKYEVRTVNGKRVVQELSLDEMKEQSKNIPMPAFDAITYNNLQADFVRFGIINFGLKFGSQNYTMVIPIDLLKPFTDQLIHSMLVTVDDFSLTSYRYQSLLDYFKVLSALNNADNLTFIGQEPIRTTVELVDEKGNSFSVERNGGYLEEQKEFYNIGYEKIEGKAYPEFTKRKDFRSGKIAVYYKIAETKEKVFYKLIGFPGKNTVNYFLDPSISTENPYSLQMAMNGDFIDLRTDAMKAFKEGKDVVVNIPDTYIGLGKVEGQYVRVYHQDDLARVHPLFFKVKSIDFKNAKKRVNEKDEVEGMEYRATISPITNEEIAHLSDMLQEKAVSRETFVSEATNPRKFKTSLQETNVNWEDTVYGQEDVKVSEKTISEVLKTIQDHGSKASKLIVQIFRNNPALMEVAKSLNITFDRGELGGKVTFTSADGKVKITSINITFDKNASPSEIEKLIAHELVHVATALLLRTENSKLSKEQVYAKMQLEKVFNDTKRIYRTANPKGGAFDYYMQNLDEFIAGALSDVNFQNYLQTLKVSKPKPTFLSKILKSILRLLGRLTDHDESGNELISDFNVFEDTVANVILLTRGAKLEQFINAEREFINQGFDGFELFGPKTEDALSKGVDKIYEAGSDLKVSIDKEGNESDTYTQSITNKVFQRVSDTITGGLSNFVKGYQKGKDWVETILNKIFDKIEKPDEARWVSEANQQMTREEAETFFRTKNKRTIASGHVHHARVELKVLNKFSKRTREEIIAKVHKYLPDMSPYFSFDEHLEWVDKVVEKVFYNLRFNTFNKSTDANERDIPITEVTLKSDLLQLAGTVDMMVQHNDGSISMIDWKSGLSILKKYESELLEYGDQFKYVHHNPMNKAKLQLMLYAVMAKLENPSLKFRHLAAVDLTNEGTASRPEAIHHVEVESFLGMIQEWLKTKHKGKYEAALKQSPKIFDISEYNGVAQTTENLVLNTNIGMENEIKLLQNKIRLIINSYQRDEDMTVSDKKLVSDMMNRLYELADVVGISMRSWEAELDDISWFDLKFSSLSAVNHPAAKLLSYELEKAGTLAQAAHREKTTKFESFMKAIMQDYQQKQGSFIGKTLGAIPFLQLKKTFNDSDYLKLFGFMYKKRKSYGAEVIGILVESDPEYIALAKEGQIGKIKQQFITFVNDSIAEHFDEKTGFLNETAVMTKNADGVKIPKSYIDLYNSQQKDPTNHFRYERGMLPIIPETDADLISKYGAIKGMGKRFNQWKAQNLTYFFENNYENWQDEQQMIPIKYLGSKQIRAEQRHSLNMELIFDKFTNAMYHKKFGETAASFGRGLVTWIEMNKGKKGTERIREFLTKQVEMVVVNRTETDLNLSRKGFRVGEVNGKEAKISAAKAVKQLSKYTASSTMAFNVVGGIQNAIGALLSALRRGLAGSILKWSPKMFVGDVKVEDLDYTLTKFGTGIWRSVMDGLVGKAIKGDIRTDKTWLLLKELNFLPTLSFWSSRSKQDLLSIQQTLFSAGSDLAFSMYSLPEEVVTTVVMTAMLKSVKINKPGHPMHGKSMYDAYEVVSERDPITGSTVNKLQYNGPVRGMVKRDGKLVELKGLDPLEIHRMKHVYREMFGAYRDEERNTLEYTVMGGAIMQFKKYFPDVLKNAFASKSKAITTGEYVPVTDENGNYQYSNGEKVLEWVEGNIEGRWRIMGKVMLNWLSATSKFTPLYYIPGIGNVLKRAYNPKYSFKSLSTRDKLHLIEGWITIGSMFALWSFMAGWEEEDDPWLRSVKIIGDNFTQQWNPREMLKNSLYFPLPASFGQTYKTFDSLSRYGFSLLTLSEVAPQVFGDSDKAKSSDGTIDGAHMLFKSIPFIGPAYKDLIAWESYMGGKDLSDITTPFKTFGAR